MASDDVPAANRVRLVGTDGDGVVVVRPENRPSANVSAPVAVSRPEPAALGYMGRHRRSAVRACRQRGDARGSLVGSHGTRALPVAGILEGEDRTRLAADVDVLAVALTTTESAPNSPCMDGLACIICTNVSRPAKGVAAERGHRIVELAGGIEIVAGGAERDAVDPVQPIDLDAVVEPGEVVDGVVHDRTFALRDPHAPPSTLMLCAAGTVSSTVSESESDRPPLKVVGVSIVLNTSTGPTTVST